MIDCNQEEIVVEVAIQTKWSNSKKIIPWINSVDLLVFNFLLKSNHQQKRKLPLKIQIHQVNILLCWLLSHLNRMINRMKAVLFLFKTYQFLEKLLQENLKKIKQKFHSIDTAKWLIEKVRKIYLMMVINKTKTKCFHFLNSKISDLTNQKFHLSKLINILQTIVQSKINTNHNYRHNNPQSSLNREYWLLKEDKSTI